MTFWLWAGILLVEAWSPWLSGENQLGKAKSFGGVEGPQGTLNHIGLGFGCSRGMPIKSGGTG